VVATYSAGQLQAVTLVIATFCSLTAAMIVAISIALRRCSHLMSIRDAEMHALPAIRLQHTREFRSTRTPRYMFSLAAPVERMLRLGAKRIFNVKYRVSPPLDRASVILSIR